MGNIYLASKLDYSNRNLSEIPSEIFKYKNLRKLNLSNNNITSISAEITKLDKIISLDLSNNKITDLRAKFFELQKLEVLIIRNNKIKILPRQIGKLTELKKLICSGNQIQDIPEEIASLQKLRILNLANNLLEYFPDSILNLENLETLYINNNKIKSLPFQDINQSLQYLKKLYCFNPAFDINQKYGKPFELLQKEKGNCYKTFKLISTSHTEITQNKSVMNNNDQKSNIFICYSHKEEKYKKEIVSYLNAMQFTGLSFSYWVDDKLESGDDFFTIINENLKKANIAIFIVSRSFMASEFIQKTELPTLLEGASANGTRFLIVIAQKCHFEDTPLGKYQTIRPNTPSNPLNSMTESQQDLVYYNLVEDIKRSLNG